MNLPTLKIRILNLLPCSVDLLRQIVANDRDAIDAAIAALVDTGAIAIRTSEMNGKAVAVDRRRTPGALPPAVEGSQALGRMRRLRAARAGQAVAA